MGKGHLLMNTAERARKGVMDEVASGRLSLREAADWMRVSYRQAKRIWARYRMEGDRGLVHRGRGRPSPRAKPSAVREAALERCRGALSGLGPTLAAEKLAEAGVSVDHETLRRWLMADGQWQRRRKRGPHRSRRERKPRFGEMVQLDGSHHRWFGPERESACLMNMVDDATSAARPFMAGQETTEAAMRVLWRWIGRYGVPRSLYLDRKSVYLAIRAPTPEEQLAGKEPLTSFGLACDKLGIGLITAHSPQAKGRVERNHGVYQDRFVHELRLLGVTDVAGANALLDGGFTDALNEKFAVAPLDPRDAHRPVPRGVDLRDVFCIDKVRTVGQDWCVRHENRYYQISRLNTPLPKPKSKIIVRRWLDGSLHLLQGEHRLAYTPLDGPPPKPTRPAEPQPAPQRKARPGAGADHPWRKRRPSVKHV